MEKFNGGTKLSRPGNMVELMDHWRKLGFSRAFVDYLDEFRARPSQRALDPEPPSGVDPEFRAFLAATVESLAHAHGLKIPGWTQRPNARLQTPVCWELFRRSRDYAPEDYDQITQATERVTPPVFRQHGILVKANVLQRV